MGRKNVTLKVDEDLYSKYRKYCKHKGLIVSRQMELMMIDQLKEAKRYA
jgi:hypothetical protein